MANSQKEKEKRKIVDVNLQFTVIQLHSPFPTVTNFHSGPPDTDTSIVVTLIPQSLQTLPHEKYHTVTHNTGYKMEKEEIKNLNILASVDTSASEGTPTLRKYSLMTKENCNRLKEKVKVTDYR